MNDFNNFSDKVTFICSGGDFSSGSVIPKWLKNSGIKISGLTKKQLAAVIKAGKNGNDLDAARKLAETFIKDGDNKPSKDPKSQEDLTTKLTDEQLQKFQYTLTRARTGTKSAAEKVKAYEEKLKAEKAKAEYDKFTSPGAVQIRNTQNSLENEALRRKLEIQSEGGRIRHAARGVLGSISDDSANTYHINKYDSGKGWVKDDDGNKVFDKGESVIGYTLKNRKGLTNMGMDLISGFDPNTDSRKVRRYKEKAKEAGMKATDPDNQSTLMQDYYKGKADKLLNKAAERKQTERVKSFGKSVNTVGDAGSLGLDFISSKHRDKTIREGGYEALKRKQAKLAYALGDRSLSTKIASGRGLLGKLHTRRIRSNRKRYARSLQYGLGFSENDLQNLSLILSKDFSDETDEVPELSWQPEEYAKLNAILTTDFETLDEQVALEKSQNNFSEEEEESDNPDSEVQTDNPTDDPKIDKGETELAVDYDNLDNDALVKILNTSFYKVNDEEKRYQESIAKGFSDEDRESDAYGEFLEGFSTFIDSSRTY